MDQIFGDATTAMPTPAQQAEVDSLMGGRSPVPSLDIRRGDPSTFTADDAIPGLDINPPPIPAEDGKSQPPTNGPAKGEGVGGWISRMAPWNKDSSKRDAGEGYGRLEQQDE